MKGSTKPTKAEIARYKRELGSLASLCNFSNGTFGKAANGNLYWIDNNFAKQMGV